MSHWQVIFSTVLPVSHATFIHSYLNMSERQETFLGNMQPYDTIRHHSIGKTPQAVSLWQDRDETQDLEMAFRLSKDLLQAVASTVMMGCDIIQALDGLLDYVQQHEHNEDLEVQQLWPQFFVFLPDI